jgi:hypothetical protein
MVGSCIDILVPILMFKIDVHLYRHFGINVREHASGLIVQE